MHSLPLGACIIRRALPTAFERSVCILSLLLTVNLLSSQWIYTYDQGIKYPPIDKPLFPPSTGPSLFNGSLRIEALRDLLQSVHAGFGVLVVEGLCRVPSAIPNDAIQKFQRLRIRSQRCICAQTLITWEGKSDSKVRSAHRRFMHGTG